MAISIHERFEVNQYQMLDVVHPVMFDAKMRVCMKADDDFEIRNKNK